MNQNSRKTLVAFDAVIRIEAESIQEIKNIIVYKIRNRPGISVQQRR